MKVIFRSAAEHDLDRIFEWIAKDDPRTAHSIVDRIIERISLLELDALAHMGRLGLVRGTRELLEYPYIIVYQVFEERGEIAVLAILHGSRDRQGRK
jgi:plasmid stabilization system protein ParE